MVMFVNIMHVKLWRWFYIKDDKLEKVDLIIEDRGSNENPFLFIDNSSKNYNLSVYNLSFYKGGELHKIDVLFFSYYNQLRLSLLVSFF